MVDLFRLAQEEDKDSPLVPLLERMREHADFSEDACFLRGYITGMQSKEKSLEKEIASLRERLERYEKT